MSYEELKTEHEILNADEQKVREMCISLKKIDAPKDFDFKLKARIANSNPGDFQPRFGFAFRYALPALAMIFVLSFLAYNSGILSSVNNNQAIAESSPKATTPISTTTTPVFGELSASTPKEQVNENSAVLPFSQETPKPFDKPQVAENNPQKAKKGIRKNNLDSIINSEDSAFKLDKTIQPNSNSNVVPQNPQNVVKVIQMPVNEILSQFGINAVFEGGKWIVKSVVPNGVGESSGIKENDIVEAIDNQIVSTEPLSAKTLNFKNITIIRNGGKLEIKLRNK